MSLLTALPWPMPALLAWAASWLAFLLAMHWNAPPIVALVLAAVFALPSYLVEPMPWRRALIASGFPLSLGVSGLLGALPPWAWLLPLALLLACYPMTAWRDAPLFPTPERALQGLAGLVPLRESPSILDAGCGLGHGLRELRREYPAARLFGIEWSWLICVACRWRLSRIAQVSRGDIWAADWSGHDLVYVFQRPESMPRAAVKAARELRAGAWLASLEFAVPHLAADRVLPCPDGRTVWLYQAPFRCR